MTKREAIFEYCKTTPCLICLCAEACDAASVHYWSDELVNEVYEKILLDTQARDILLRGMKCLCQRFNTCEECPLLNEACSKNIDLSYVTTEELAKWYDIVLTD